MFERPLLFHRLFFAFVPPPVLARQVIAAAAVLRCRTMAAERLHMTMFILDDLPRLDVATVARMRRIGEAIETGPIEIVLDRIAGSYRSVALRPGRANPALLACHRRIAGLAHSVGLAPRQDYRFGPHVTLGYDNPTPWSERVAPLRWIADELVLIHSRVGQTRHEVLGRWRLAATATEQLALF